VNPEKINSSLQKITKEVAQQQSEKITKALAEHGIDWSLNPFLKTPAAEKLSLSWFAEEIAADQVQLKVKLRNTSELSGQRLLVVTKSGNVLLDGLEFPLGLLGPDAEVEKTIKVNYFAGMMEETEPLELVLFDHNLQKLKSVRLQLKFFTETNSFISAGYENI